MWRQTPPASGRNKIGNVGQRRGNDLTLGSAKRTLRRHRIADVITLDLERGLDAGGKVEAREYLVDPPQAPLQVHGLRPAAGAAKLVERHTLPRDDAGRSRHPADAADQHDAG